MSRARVPCPQARMPAGNLPFRQRWDWEGLRSATRCTHYEICRQSEANRLALLDRCEGSIRLNRTRIPPIIYRARRLQQRQEHFDGSLAHCIEWLSYGAEGWPRVGGQRNIVETNERQILWHP